MKKRKICVRLLIIIIGIYAVFTIFNQQKTLNQYSTESEDLSQQIAEEKETNQELNNQKDNVNSLEFIEQMAREKLDMYYPNERVYIDQGM